MKNFFKKLSFVLAVAMVLTSLTPAVASAASKNFVTLKGNSSKAVTSVYAWIGGVTRNLDYNIGGKTSGVKGTWKSNNTKVVKVNASTGVLTPVANGTTTVTFTPSNGKNAVKTTVKVRTRAAALHIYDKAEYATGVKNPLEEKEGVTPSAIEMKVGDTLDLKVTMPLSKKQQDAGAKIASYFTYAEVDDNAVVEAALDPESNQRGYTLTAKAVGETTVTIVANQTTQANVRAKKYHREATIKVVVTDDTVGFGASQTGAKEIKVTGLEGAAKDDMEVTLKRGSITIPTASVKAEDANTLVLTTAARLQDATYTVTVDKKEASFTGAAEKLTNLSITGEYAVVDNIDIRQAKSATVPYEAKNQFGEDMNVSLTASSSLSQSVTAKNGIITISFNATSGTSVSLIEGQVISVSVVSPTDGKSAAATVTLSSSSKIKTLTVEGIYNAEDLTFNEDNKSKGKFYLVLDAEDQYGYKVTDAKKAKGSLMAVCTNSLVATMGQESGSSELIYETLTIKGVKKLGVQIIPQQAGTTNVILTPKYYGGSVQHEVTVLSGTKVDVLTFIQPEEAYRGKELLIPVEAVDANGNAITDPKALNEWVGTASGKLNITSSTGNQYTKPFEKTSAGVLVYNAGVIGEGVSVVSINATTPTYKFASIVVYMKDAATPARIEKISADKVLNLVSGGSVNLKITDFTIRDTDEGYVDTYAFPSGYSVKAEVVKQEGTSLHVTGTSIDSSHALTVTAGAVTGDPHTLAVNFTIVKGGEEVSDPYPVTFKNMDLKKLVRAEIKAPEKIYAGNNEAYKTHTRAGELQVYGFDAAGNKVIIPTELWDITNLDAVSDACIKIATGSGIAGASIGAIETVTWSGIAGTPGARTQSATISIVVSQSSIGATKLLTASEARPTLTTIAPAFGSTVKTTGTNQYTAYIGKNIGQVSGASIVQNFSIKDQYGVEYSAYGAYTKNYIDGSNFEKVIAEPIIMVSNTSGDVSVVANGTKNPQITMASGSSCTVTITWGGQTITVNVEKR